MADVTVEHQTEHMPSAPFQPWVRSCLQTRSRVYRPTLRSAWLWPNAHLAPCLAVPEECLFPQVEN